MSLLNAAMLGGTSDTLLHSKCRSCRLLASDSSLQHDQVVRKTKTKAISSDIRQLHATPLDHFYNIIIIFSHSSLGQKRNEK